MPSSSTTDLALFLATTGPDERLNKTTARHTKSTQRRRMPRFSKFYTPVKRNCVVPKYTPLPVKYVESPAITCSATTTTLPSDMADSSESKTCTPSTTITVLVSSFPRAPSTLSHPPQPQALPASCPHCAHPIPLSQHPTTTPTTTTRRKRRTSCPAVIKYTQQQATPGLTSQEAKTLLQLIERLQQQIVKEKVYRRALEDALLNCI